MGVRTLLTSLRNRFDGLTYEIWEEEDGNVKWYCNGLDHRGEHVTLAGWEDLRFPAQSINPLGSAAPPTVDTSDFPGTLLFDNNVVNILPGIAQMPHDWKLGSSVHPHIHWAKTTSAVGGVVWEFRYVIADIGEVFGNYSDWEPCSNPVPDADTQNRHSVAAFNYIDMSTFKESSIMLWTLQRNTAAIGDTYGADARLLEFDIHYQKDSFGSILEF